MRRVSLALSQIPLPTRPHWYLLFGATEEEIKDICITTLKLYTRKKVRAFRRLCPDLHVPTTRSLLTSVLSSQPNYDFLEREVEKRKVALQEAKLKAKGLNPDGTPALSTLGGFSPASKPGSPNAAKADEKSPNPQLLKAVKKEAEDRAQGSKSPHNG